MVQRFMNVFFLKERIVTKIKYMSSQSHNILVPIDFTQKNEWAIERAIEMANSLDCNLHLVHVVCNNLLPFAKPTVWQGNSAALRHAAERLVELKHAYQSELTGQASIEISVLQGDPYVQLGGYIEQYKMVMMVLGLPRFSMVREDWSCLSISRMARLTNIPVLAVRRNILTSQGKKILLPIYHEIAYSHIQLAALLGRHLHAGIYLLSLRNGQGSRDQDLLNETLGMMKRVGGQRVHSVVMNGRDLVNSTFEFSKKIDADFVMIHPVKTVKVPGIWTKVADRFISYTSRISSVALKPRKIPNYSAQHELAVKG